MSTTVYQVTLGDRVLTVTLRVVGDDVYARVDDGEERLVRLDEVGGVLYALAIGTARSELLAHRTPDTVELAIDGLTYQAEVLDEAHARLASMVGGSSGHQGRRELKAPMPGLVVRIVCQPGDTVEANEPLVVLQAMKMENELSFPRGGTVISVAVAPGQTVEQGQVLAVVE